MPGGRCRPGRRYASEMPALRRRLGGRCLVVVVAANLVHALFDLVLDVLETVLDLFPYVLGNVLGLVENAHRNPLLRRILTPNYYSNWASRSMSSRPV